MSVKISLIISKIAKLWLIFFYKSSELKPTFDLDFDFDLETDLLEEPARLLRSLMAPRLFDDVRSV